MTTSAPVLDTADQPDPERPRRRDGARRRRWVAAAIAGVAGLVTAVAVALAPGSGPGDDEDGEPRGAADATTTETGPGGAGATAVAAPVVTVDGLVDGAVLGQAALAELRLTVLADGRPAPGLVASLDGEPMPGPEGEPLTIDAEAITSLADGEHSLTVASGEADDGSPLLTIAFTLDRLPPVVTLPEVVEGTARDDQLVVDVTLDAAATLTADGADVTWSDDTSATVTWQTTPATVAVTATDAAGNVTTVQAPVVVPFPGGRAVHVTPSAWRYEPKRTPIIELLEQGLIDAVQLDIKDELGDVSWDTDVELAELSGAEDFNRDFDVRAAIETIHSYDARVIGRLVVYRDTRLAQWAWNNGRPDMVLQATDGTPYAGRYGDYAFTNFANPDVQQYNIDIALEAAEVGFDDVLYDYIRRPDGAIEKLVVPGLGDRTPEDAVVEVMARAYPLLRERGVWVGASVFGIAVDRPTQMAQHIPSMAPHVDYIAPMVYPNHWNLGEYDVPVPEDAPYDIVERSLTLYREALEGTGVALVPWLQDFGGYGEAEVRAQIDATEAVTGERSFMLWSSGATYTHEALDPIPGRGPGAGDGDGT